LSVENNQVETKENLENEFNETENSNILLTEDKKKYDFDYSIYLNIKNEDGLLESYLFDNYHEPEKQKADPSEWFNFGNCY